MRYLTNSIRKKVKTMSERIWTDEQKAAIENRDGTLIVSAAAGSGKTSVLVERVIRRLIDEENPCDADRLLIVTFTRAATAEMRSRLGSALRTKLKENPDSEHLQKQQMLLPSANIFTIDAFCGNLVRENFDALNIPPDFTMLDEAEGNILKRNAVSSVMDKFYDEKDPDFLNLVELLFAGRDDSSLEDNILALYEYSRAYPSPSAWLNGALREYDPETPMKDSAMGKIIRDSSAEILDYHHDKLSFMLEELKGIPDFDKLGATSVIENEIQLNRELYSLIDAFKFDEALTKSSTYKFSTWSAKGYEKDPIVIKAKAIRDAHKKELSQDDSPLRKNLIFTDEENKEELTALRPIAKKLIEAVKLFETEFSRLKAEKKALDFSDIELLALKLLVKDPSCDEITRTELAIDLSESYEEILIDEYQDTNKLQDLIFTAISKNGNNLFMVGDVKQSIYGFRQAMPEIFIQKRNTSHNRITLGANFRSRKGVTDFINFTFSQLMSPECGDVDYDENEKLVYHASYDDVPEPETEIHIIEPDEKTDSLIAQANFISEYINSKIDSKEAKYKDFAILLRTAAGRANEFEKVMKAHGIPVYTDVGNGFFTTPDVQIVLSLLRVIDNPLHDIPLLSAMLSPIYGFTETEVSKLRVDFPHGSLYSAVLCGEKNGNEKCRFFLDSLRIYRTLCISLPAGELVRQIYEDTCFPEIVGAMPGGAQRTANLRLFLNYADSYDKTSSYGISGFIRLIDKMIENEIDKAPAGTISENADVVRIMSIHKSKGLEFKYCILADVNKSFNRQELSRNLLLHQTLGIGIKGRDFSSGNTYPTLVHRAIRMASENKLMSEALRVFYVALTRAKEKLVIVGVPNSKTSTLVDKAIIAATGSNLSVSPYAVKHANTLLDWLLYAIIRHPSAKVFRDRSILPCAVLPSDFEMTCEMHTSDEEEVEGSEEQEPISTVNEELVHEIEGRIKYVYPYLPLTEISTKRSASKIEENGFSDKFFASSRPEFASKAGLTPAERGTSLHKFMQYTRFDVVESDISSELKRLVDEEFLSEKEANSVDKDKISNFFKSDIYKRIKSSSSLMREKKFAILVPAGDYDDTLRDDLKNEPILIQGIADCIFEEDGKLVILDYKTDKTKDENELINRHRLQLETYSRALEKALGIPVKEAYIYAFSLDREIKVL